MARPAALHGCDSLSCHAKDLLREEHSLARANHWAAQACDEQGAWIFGEVMSSEPISQSLGYNHFAYSNYANNYK